MITYKDLEWELKLYRDENNNRQFSYDKSLERIREEGDSNARHPYPNELFGLIIDGFEGKLTGNLKSVCVDILEDYGGWFSMAFERKKDKLIAYLDPQNLKADGDYNYIVDGKKLEYSSERVFDINGIQSDSFIDLKNFKDDFVTFMYGRSFDDLPHEMKTGHKTANVFLPCEGIIWPVGQYLSGIFDVFSGNSYLGSRWVRPKKVKE